MEVVARARAPRSRRTGTAGLHERFGNHHILGRGDLQVTRIALHEMHVMPRRFGEHRLVGGVGRRGRDRQRVAEDADAERLWRLRQEDLVARQRAADDAPRVAALHRIARLQRSDRRAVFHGGVDGSLEQRRRHQRPRRVVNDDHLRARRHRANRIGDRILPPFTPLDEDPGHPES